MITPAPAPGLIEVKVGPAGGAKVKAMKNPPTHDREWVRLDQGLSVADVGMHDWIGRGRTFARTLH